MQKTKKTAIVLILLAALSSVTGCGVSGFQNEEMATSETTKTSAAELILQADALYRQRAEDLQKVKNALQLLRQARIADGNNFETAWKIAQYNYFLGNNTKIETERDKAFKDGAAAGKIAISLAPDKPQGYFWEGANLGGQARASVIAAAANINDIKQNMQKVIEIDPAYEGAAAYLVLAKIELETRGMLGGDAAKAANYLEKAVALVKDNPMLYVSLAEAYFYANRKLEARRMLAQARKIPPDPEYAAEYAEAMNEAKKIEEKL
jgi:tetratricopeptide (TPR) repeat protein